MTTIEVRGVALDPREIVGVRRGNSLWPGLAAFTGVTFLVYLAVKAASGATPVNAGLFAQLAVAAVLLAVGGFVMSRGRYFHLAVETRSGVRRIAGLSKAEQEAAAAAIEAAISAPQPAP